eukprot:scaffold9295_cov122-Isochrysis_galbana.AAC.2
MCPLGLPQAAVQVGLGRAGKAGAARRHVHWRRIFRRVHWRRNNRAGNGAIGRRRLQKIFGEPFQLLDCPIAMMGGKPEVGRFARWANIYFGSLSSETWPLFGRFQFVFGCIAVVGRRNGGTGREVLGGIQGPTISTEGSRFWNCAQICAVVRDG